VAHNPPTTSLPLLINVAAPCANVASPLASRPLPPPRPLTSPSPPAFTCAQEVANYLGMELGQRVIKKFADGEVYVQIQESIRGCDVFLAGANTRPHFSST